MATAENLKQQLTLFIPKSSCALADIAKLSRNHEFRHGVLTLLNCADLGGVDKIIEAHFWNVSKARYNVEPSANILARLHTLNLHAVTGSKVKGKRLKSLLTNNKAKKIALPPPGQKTLLGWVIREPKPVYGTGDPNVIHARLMPQQSFCSMGLASSSNTSISATGSQRSIAFDSANQAMTLAEYLKDFSDDDIEKNHQELQESSVNCVPQSQSSYHHIGGLTDLGNYRNRHQPIMGLPVLNIVGNADYDWEADFRDDDDAICNKTILGAGCGATASWERSCHNM